MSMVERLAKRSSGEQYPFIVGSFDGAPEAYRNNARWWLNAIADELEYAYDQESDGCVATHLRTQAQEEA